MISSATADSLLRSLPGKRSKLMILALLIVTADFLLFGQDAGINWFLFANLISLTLLLTAKRPISSPQKLALGLLSLVATLPLLEAMTWMGFTVAITVLATIALASARLMPRSPNRLPSVLARLVIATPLRFFTAPFRMIIREERRPTISAAWPWLRVWLVPLLLASIFVLLFAIANPLIEIALDRIDLALLLQFLDPFRVAFWLFTGFTLRVLLRPLLQRRTRRQARPEAHARLGAGILFGTAPLLRSLALFNAVFALQTGLDLVYLWGGASLPEGMTHAQYAHRGAYPLLVTALLAAAFVLAAMRPDGPGVRNPLIRLLVYVWIGQNVLLCVSAMLRLDLYVETYSLTGLRLAAGIWMGLIAAGLLFILLRILTNRSNAWLVAMNCAALALVLFFTALQDLPGTIARFNVDHSLEGSGNGPTLDLYYLSTLGTDAIPALDRYIASVIASPDGKPPERLVYARNIRDELAASVLDQDDWRGWTWRKARLAAYLRETATVAR